MRFLALATDYDGTLASHGVVGGATVQALERVAASGRKLVLVTGREIDDIEQVFAHLALFDRVVAENGAVLYTPSSKTTRRLAQPPPLAFVKALAARGVDPLAVGQVIVATHEPYGAVVSETIRAMGLALHVEFNKGAVMVLPEGTNKATGLAAALRELQVSPTDVVGIGDGENDIALLGFCGFAVSVANAVPALKELSNWVTPSPEGAGFVELVDRELAATPRP